MPDWLRRLFYRKVKRWEIVTPFSTCVVWEYEDVALVCRLLKRGRCEVCVREFEVDEPKWWW